MDAADGSLLAGVIEWIPAEVLKNVRSKPANQRSSSMQPVFWRSVAELMAGMLW